MFSHYIGEQKGVFAVCFTQFSFKICVITNDGVRDLFNSHIGIGGGGVGLSLCGTLYSKISSPFIMGDKKS